MEKLTIYDIKEMTKETAPYFFDRKTMRFFGQTMKSFKVYRQEDSGKYLIVAGSGSNWSGKHETRRLFNPITKELEHVEEAKSE